MSPAATAISIEDASLVRQTQRGDMAAFARLVTKYQDRVYNTCWRLCGHVEDARDLTQEAFVRALEAIGRFQHKAGFYTWLFRIAVNLAISHRRRSGRTMTLSLHDDDDGSRIVGSQASDLIRRTRTLRQEDPASVTATREVHRAVLSALDELDEDHRTVLVLRDVESFDYEEIANILELPTGTIKSRIHRARMALRAKLAPIIEGGAA